MRCPASRAHPNPALDHQALAPNRAGRLLHHGQVDALDTKFLVIPAEVSPARIAVQVDSSDAM